MGWIELFEGEFGGSVAARGNAQVDRMIMDYDFREGLTDSLGRAILRAIVPNQHVERWLLNSHEAGEASESAHALIERQNDDGYFHVIR